MGPGRFVNSSVMIIYCHLHSMVRAQVPINNFAIPAVTAKLWARIRDFSSKKLLYFLLFYLFCQSVNDHVSFYRAFRV